MTCMIVIDNPIKNVNLKKRLIIEAKYINNKSYIENLIKKKENTCDKEGYIQKINNVSKISFYKFYEQNFLGSILIDVEFNADIITLENDKIVEAKIIQANEDGIVAEGIYPIFFIIDSDYESLSFLNVNDIVLVKVMKFEISIDRNMIKGIVKYIQLKDLERDEYINDEHKKND